jgi:hypothetical protein
MPQVQHASITDPEIHECKGASSATLGQVPISDGVGGAPFGTLPFTKTDYGYVDIADLTTATTQIPLTLANTNYQLTNDSAGADTFTLAALPGMVDIWNPSTNYFDFSDMKLNDILDIRVDVEVTTTSASNFVELSMEFGIGGASYNIPVSSEYYKTARTYHLVGNLKWYLGNTLTKDSPARLLIKNDSTGSTVKVNGWYIVGHTHG